MAAPDSQPLLQEFNTRPSLSHSWSRVSLGSLEDGDSSELDSDIDEEVKLQSGFWRRWRMATRRRRDNVSNRARYKAVQSLLGGEEKRLNFKIKRRGFAARVCVVTPFLVFILFGTVHILNIFLGHFPTFLDNSNALDFNWSIPDKELLDVTRDVSPIPCHSHNDYWRRVPLYDALRYGCTGIEADVWLFDEELHVGHSTNALTPNRTFRSMYVDPLVALLDHQNNDSKTTLKSKSGLFPKSPTETVVLLVDFKNNGHDIFPVVSSHLAALREKGYLTYYNGSSTVSGPITVVATGNAPFDLIIANTTYRDIFFDAPLDRLYIDPSPSPSTSPPPPSSPSTPTAATLKTTLSGQGTVGTTPTSHFDSTNSFYASTNFGRTIGWLWFGSLSPTQLHRIRGQIQGARARGLKPRYWSAPKWPVARRNGVWKVLVREGIAYLNGDDLKGMRGIMRREGPA